MQRYATLATRQTCRVKQWWQLSGGTSPEESDVLITDVHSEALNLQLVDFKLPPPKELAEDERTNLIASSIARIWDGAEELKTMGEAIPADSSQAGGNSAAEMWMLLLVRMITRVAEPPPTLGDDAMDGSGDEMVVHDFYARQDQLRQTLCDYIMTDFPSRCVYCGDPYLFHGFTLSNRIRLATTWMNEEWYNDQIRCEEGGGWVMAFLSVIGIH